MSVLVHTEDSPATITVLVSTRDNILKYNIVRNTFSSPTPLNRPNLSAYLTPFEGNKIIVSGQNNQIFSLTIKDMQMQGLLNSNYQTDTSLLKLAYYIPLNNRRLQLPVIVGCQVKALVTARKDGKIYLWNNYEELSNHNFLTLDAHTSPIADFSYTANQKYLYSSGSRDEMIVEWRIAYFNEEKSATKYRMRDWVSDCNHVDLFSQRRM